MYKYSFDETHAGGFGPRRADYLLIHEALQLLAQKLSSWNEVALKHGALKPPYTQEVEDLTQMIQWGDKQLANPDLAEIRERGVTVGSFRYFKAALLHATWHFEQEIASTAQAHWPGGVVEAMRGKVRRIQELAAHLNYEPADILDELRPEYGTMAAKAQGATWDVFLSHASEDKAGIASPLAAALVAKGLTVWYDEFALTVGDSLRRSIDRGLAHSQFGIVVLSKRFFEKEWPQKELDALVSKEINGVKVILPVWHEITESEVRKFSPTLADRVGVSTGLGLERVSAALIKAMGK